MLATFYYLTIFLMLSGAASGHGSSVETDVVRYAKGLSVNKLDPALPLQRLEVWLRSGPPHLDEVSWYASPDCDLREPPDPVPYCVRVSFRRGKVSGLLLITVGTRAKPIGGPPHLEYFAIRRDGNPSGEWLKAPYGETKLSELPRVLDRVSAQRSAR